MWCDVRMAGRTRHPLFGCLGVFFLSFHSPYVPTVMLLARTEAPIPSTDSSRMGSNQVYQPRSSFSCADPSPAQIAELRREEDEYMDSAYRRRRTRSRRDGGAPANVSGGGDSSGGGGGGGREKAYSDDYNDRACATLLKYKRVAGFVLGAGAGGREAGDTRKSAADVAHVDVAGPCPEDIVRWLDARLLDKNIPPLYRTGLRPEHAPVVLETLMRSGGGGGGTGIAGATRTSVALGGLEEAVVREIVVGEASRAGGESESADTGVEGAPAEVAEAVAAMFGEGQGQGGGEGQDQDQAQPQRGPWQQK